MDNTHKIIFKLLKIKGKNKTHIYGLDGIMDNTKLESVLKKIRKKLEFGSIIIKDDNDIQVVEFMGDVIDKIKDYIVMEKIVDVNMIECNIESDIESNINDIDMMIIIKYHKLKGKNKTYIYGLEKVLDSVKLDIFLKKIKCRLGCGGLIKEDDTNNPMIEFMGDHRDKIKDFIIEEKVIDSSKIILKGA